MKYVVVTWGHVEVPIVFPDFMAHSIVAQGINKESKGGMKVVSAGFCKLGGFSGEAFGRSESLKMDARVEEDSELLTKLVLDCPDSSYLKL